MSKQSNLVTSQNVRQKQLCIAARISRSRGQAAPGLAAMRLRRLPAFMPRWLFQPSAVRPGSTRSKRVNRGLQLSFHHLGQLMDGQSDAMIGEAVLREIVGADFLAPVSAAHLLFRSLTKSAC